jgi:N-acyl-D-aspartate/D-glutamate deacylase
VMFDLVIRGGTVVDGWGGPAVTADVAVSDGVIAAVGKVDERGGRELDANGAVVAPGFVDIHTHYDGQVTWDNRLKPSSAHGVTTAVMGNCGVGFAPVRPTDHDQLIELMEGVEDLPGTVLHEGLTWTWESIQEYLDAVESAPHDIDFAAQVCHGPLRLYVMGRRGADRAPATAGEIAEMGRLAAEGIRAGALGFSTSRTLNHKTSRGEPTPSLGAARAELVGIAEAIGATGRGVLQVVSDLIDLEDEMATMLAMMRASGRPLSLSLSEGRHPGDYRHALDAIEKANAEGLRMRAVVATRAIGVVINVAGSRNPWANSATFQSGADLSDPEVKRRILQEIGDLGGVTLPLERVYELGDPPEYEPHPSSSVLARARHEGRPADDVLYDILARGCAYMPALNYLQGNLDAVGDMLAHEHTVPGLGDGGAHVGLICDASFPTTLVTHWTRDRTRGERFPLSWVSAQQSRATAEAVGLLDRGVLAPGYKADINVIDMDGLGVLPPRFVKDLPAGGRRVLQDAVGYLHTFVSGTEVYASGEPTGALPGRLVRGARGIEATQGSVPFGSIRPPSA